MSTLRVNNMTNVGGTGPTYAPGHVIQAVSTTVSTQFSLSSSAWVDVTNFFATITPKYASSKILIIASVPMETSASDSIVSGTIVRGTTNLGNGNYGFGYVWGLASRIGAPSSFSYLDSPATTSAITYKINARSTTSAGLICGGSTPGTITLMEIAG